MNGRYSKKLRQLARRQFSAMAPQMRAQLWQRIKKEFFAMLPKMSFRERVRLAWRIIWAKKVELEKK